MADAESADVAQTTRAIGVRKALDARAHSDGSLGPAFLVGHPILGNLQGTQEHLDTCPQGKAGVGVNVRSETYIDGIGLICGPVASADHWSDATDAPYRGGLVGGRPYSDPCAWGTALTGFAVQHGTVIDSLQGYFMPVEM
jgi:hypothetical protein